MELAPGTYTIRVTPKASSNRIKTEDDGSIRVYVTTAPEDGKANKKVIEVLAKELKIAKSRIAIIKGETSRDKTIVIS